uniref:C2H2-type domain-containing protein n=1 Tax=viral metagenome TaxID=1070528 RepID=A0A6C0IIW0_9ZZZZ
MITEKEQKNADEFICKDCDFTCSKQSNFDKHLSTRKHKIVTNSYKKMPKMPNKYMCICGKEYVYRQGLYTHKKTCKEDSPEEVKSLTTMVMELMKSNTELQKQLVDVCKNSNTTNIHTNNSNNSHNKTFNLQFFLNEQCKDAMNISDFANSINLQLSDFESVGELGYVEGITKIMLDKLNSMDIYKRPIHCSDAKREIIYVKDDDKWEKEEKNNPKLRYAIKTISFNNMKLMGLWSSTYPESMDGDSRLNDKYMKLIKQSTGGNGEIEDSENKIIRRIVKEIIIDKV